MSLKKKKKSVTPSMNKILFMFHQLQYIMCLVFLFIYSKLRLFYKERKRNV